MEALENNKKYLAILHSSRKLFWKHGFRRVSIEEICREAKASKMTFYRFFPNKLELARAVFDSVADEGLQKFRKIINEESSPSEKMKKIIQLKLEGTNNISNEFLNDFYNNPESGLANYIEEKTKALWLEIIELFRKGQADGWIRKDMNVEFMFLFIQKATSSSVLSDKEILKLYNSPQDLIMELTNMFVYGISPAK
ncbi:MAG: TetR/AcrR family transcriptional regulator [Bacteroidales bacterium]